MKTILVLTDFSPAAGHAASYALQLARTLKLKVRLCHIRPEASPDITSEQWFNYILKLKRGFRPRSGEQMHPSVTFTCEMGSVETAACRLVAEDESALVVMGMTGMGRKSSSWGSHVSALLDTMNVPLLLVPEKATYRRVKRIGYATDLTDRELPVIQSVITLARDFQSAVYFWYITTGTANHRSAKHKLDDLLRQVAGYSINTKVTVRLLTARDAAHGLEWISKNAGMQMLVMNHEHRPLLERRISPSNTLTLARTIDIPLLVYPKNGLQSAFTVF
ncbi:MAG: universal stress protein [Mucilaginibacter sp.]